MASLEAEPTEKFPQEKAKKLFEKMRAELRGEAGSDPQVNEDGGIILDDGIEVIPNRVEKDLEETRSVSPEQPEDEANFQTGSGAMDEWQKKQEAKEDERFEQANN